MVEMHYPPTEDRGRFDKFYNKHISMLLTIEGFQSAQRYVTTHEARAPFLAVYRLRDPGVMTSKNYTSKAGPTSVDPKFKSKMTNWDRNLVTGDIETMDVPDNGWMVLIDRLTADCAPLPEGFTSLEIIGLDTTIAERGVLVGDGGKSAAPAAQNGWIIRSFRAIQAPRHPA